MADEEVYYSAKHWAKKSEKFANETKDTKEAADTAIALVDGFDTTVSQAQAAIINLSTEEKNNIRTIGDEEEASVVSAGETGVANIKAAETTGVANVNQATNNGITQINGMVSNLATKTEVATNIANYQASVNVLTATSGSISLEVNKVYTLSVTNATTFVLPTPSNTDVFNQIKVMMSVTGAPTIDWGTIYFFNKTTPEIETGSYDVYFDYDNLLGAWVCGVMAKGVAE